MPDTTTPLTDAQRWATTKRVGEHAAMKMFSARWFCTIGAVWVWAMMNFYGLNDPDMKVAIITFDASTISLIVKSYFDDKREDE